MKQRQQTMSILVILLIPVMGLCLLSSCTYNPMVQAVEPDTTEADSIKMASDEQNRLWSCKFAKQDSIIQAINHELDMTNYEKSVLEKNVETLQESKKKLENLQKKLTDKNQVLQKDNTQLQGEVSALEINLTNHKLRIEQQRNRINQILQEKDLGNESRKVLVNKVDVLMSELAEVNEQLDIVHGMKPHLLSPIADNADTTRAVVRVKQQIHAISHRELTDFARTLQVGWSFTLKDESAMPLKKHNLTKFRESWRRVYGTLMVEHALTEKLHNPDFMKSLRIVIRNYENNDLQHVITEAKTNKDYLDVPYTNATANLPFTFFLDKQTSGNRFVATLYYVNPMTQELIDLKEQVIFEHKSAITTDETPIQDTSFDSY